MAAPLVVFVLTYLLVSGLRLPFHIIVLEQAGPAGKVGFLEFLRYGAVLCVATVALALGVVRLEQLMGF